MNVDPQGSKYYKAYMYLVSLAGAAICIHSAISLSIGSLDAVVMTVALATIFLGSRIGIGFSRHQIQLTAADTFVFLALLLYGGEVAVIVAAGEAFYSSFRFSQLWLTRFFNGALLACSTFFAYLSVTLLFGQPQDLLRGEAGPALILAIGVLALAQFASNSCLAALRESLKSGRRFIAIWREHFLWTAVTLPPLPPPA
jgi:hypothetical protein